MPWQNVLQMEKKQTSVNLMEGGPHAERAMRRFLFMRGRRRSRAAKHSYHPDQFTGSTSLFAYTPILCQPTPAA